MNAGLDLIAARALLYGGALVAFGLPAYLACAPQAARLWLEEQRRIWRYVAVAAGVGLAATLVHLLLLSAAMNGVALGQVDRDMLGFVGMEMPVGRAALARAAALSFVLLAAPLLQGRARIAACALAGAAALASLSWNGHAMMNDGATGWTHLIADQIHLLAAGIWLGALIALLALARVSGAPGIAARQEAFASFSFVGTIVVALLVLTGLTNSVMILVVPGGGAPARSYLLLLALKLVLFLGALALAANNRFRLTPGLSRAGGDVRLRRSVAVELAFVVATVLIVAILGLLSPTQ